MEKLDLHGKTGFIIGGTRGIGNAIAMRMAGLGMNLTVIARKEDELAAMKAQVESLGVRFLGIQARTLTLTRLQLPLRLRGRPTDGWICWSMQPVPAL